MVVFKSKKSKKNEKKIQNGKVMIMQRSHFVALRTSQEKTDPRSIWKGYAAEMAKVSSKDIKI